jgi:outer membrane receptor protein involved in Fe transport
MYQSKLPRLAGLLFVFSILFATQSWAQAAGSVSGKLHNSKKQPVSYATVTLMRNDSTIAGGDLSKDDGSFSITPVAVGNYHLRIQAIGVTTKWMDVGITDAANKNLGTIKLDQTDNTLKDVTVTGEKAVMELKVDKKVFNVEKNTTTAGGSATDVLQNVPSISVDADGNISLRGKGNVNILIDGKPATLLGGDVASALQSLPASSISNVEVITNPSAKYDAQGTTGIINIITKKDGRLGMNGTATVGAGTNDKYNGNLGLSLRKGKWNTFLNSSFRVNNTWNNVTNDRTDKVPTDGNYQYHYTYEHVPRKFNGYFNAIGATYDADQYNSFTFTGNVNKMAFGFKDYSDYNVYSRFGEPHTRIFNQQRNSSFSGNPFSLSGSIDYKRKFKKKDEELTANATYANTTMERRQYFDTRTVDTSISLVKQRAPGKGGNNTLTVLADYTDPLFTKNGKLGLGFKSQFFEFTSDNKSFVDSGFGEKADLTLKADFDYRQTIHAAYINWNDQLGKFSYQLGLRAENAIYDGEGKVPYDSSFHNSFTNLFPSAFASYQLKNQQTVYLSYTRRTNRPGFMQLIPFVDLSNPSTINKGNPALLPEFIHNIEANYNKTTKKGNNYIFSAYYAYTQNMTEKIIRPVDSAEAATYHVSENALFSQPVNIKSGVTYGLEGMARIQIMKPWDATMSVNVFQNQLTIGNSNPYLSSLLSNNSGITWFGKLNTNVRLPKNFSLQINANYEGPKVITQGNQSESYWVDVALRKNLWKNKATLVLNCSDIFLTRVFITDYITASYDQTINRVKETRIGNITFTYRFGKSDMGKGSSMGGGKQGKGDKKSMKPSGEDREKNLKGNDDDNQGGGSGGMK